MKHIKLTDAQYKLLIQELSGLQNYYRAGGDIEWSDKIENLADCIEMSSWEKID